MKHLHDFMVKFVIFNVNQVNFVQEQCTVTLIQHKQRSKNRLGAETTAALRSVPVTTLAR